MSVISMPTKPTKPAKPAKPTIASQQAEIARLNEQLAQLNALNAAQQAKFEVLHTWAEKASTELKALRAKPQARAPKPKAPIHKPGELIEPPRFRVINGIRHRAYYGRSAGTIGWRPCQASAPQQTCEPPPWDTEFVQE